MPATYTNIDHGTFHWVMMTVQWNLITALWELEDKLNVPRTSFRVNGHPMPNIVNYIPWQLPLDAGYTLPDIYDQGYIWVENQSRMAGLSKAECIGNLALIYNRIEQLLTTWVQGNLDPPVAWYTGPYGPAEEETLSNPAGRHLVRITKYADRFIHYDSLADYAEEACGISELQYPSCCWNARMGKSWTDAALLLNNIKYAAVMPWTQLWYEMEGVKTRDMTEGDYTVIPPILPELSGYANIAEWIWDEDELEAQVQTWWGLFHDGHAVTPEPVFIGWNPPYETEQERWLYEGGALLWAAWNSRAMSAEESPDASDLGWFDSGTGIFDSAWMTPEQFELWTRARIGNYFVAMLINQGIPYKPLALVMPSYVRGTLNAGSVPVHFGWSDNFNGDVTVTLRINGSGAGSLTLPEGWDSIIRNQPLDQHIPMALSLDIEVPETPPWDWQYEMENDPDADWSHITDERLIPPAESIVANEEDNGFFLARLNPLNANTWVAVQDDSGAFSEYAHPAPPSNYGICYIVTL